LINETAIKILCTLLNDEINLCFSLRIPEAYLPTRRGFDSTYGYWSGFIDYTTKMSRMTYFKKPGYMFYENDTVDYKGRNENCDILFARRAEQIIRHHRGDALQGQIQAIHSTPGDSLPSNS
jgi:hypothetical protein